MFVSWLVCLSENSLWDNVIMELFNSSSHQLAAPSVRASVRPPHHPSVPPPVCPSIYPSASPSLPPPVPPSFLPSTRPSILPSLHPSVRPSLSPSVRLSFPWSLPLSLCPTLPSLPPTLPTLLPPSRISLPYRLPMDLMFALLSRCIAMGACPLQHLLSNPPDPPAIQRTTSPAVPSPPPRVPPQPSSPPPPFPFYLSYCSAALFGRANAQRVLEWLLLNLRGHRVAHFHLYDAGAVDGAMLAALQPWSEHLEVTDVRETVKYQSWAAGQVRDEQEQELTPLRSDVERGEGGGEDERRSGRSGSGGEMRMASGERTRVSSPPLAAATAAATAAPDGQPAVPAGARSARANERSMSEVALQLSVFGFEVRCAARRECARGSSKAP